VIKPPDGHVSFRKWRDKSILIFTIALIVLSGIGITVIWEIKSGSVKLVASPTRKRAYQLCVAVKAFYADYGYYPSEITTVGEGGFSNRRVVAALTGREVERGYRRLNTNNYQYLDTSQEEWCDKWQQPYHIIWDIDGDEKIVMGVTTVSDDVVIWSVGKNGVNEWGYGDDVKTF